jgi:hypothetical protein
MKKTPLLSTTLINKFERSCGTFKERGGKQPIVINDIRLVCLRKNIKIQILIKNNNDHGVDVNIIVI